MQATTQMPFFPPQASSAAADVDNLYFILLAVTVFFTVAILGALAFFAIHYRRRDDGVMPKRVETSKTLEIVWTAIPILLVTGLFFMGADIFFSHEHAPLNSMEISVTGKQWMWKFQHLNGRREINSLHVPLGQPVKMTMASEDVIHNLAVPAFRIKQDVMPGRYTSEWFQATRKGEYHIFCDQYCGTNHSVMTGTVYVMDAPDYQAWLSGYTGKTPVQAGEELFSKFACNTCHIIGQNSRGPNLAGVFGSKVLLEGGATVTADANYIRESILTPQKKIVGGFQPIMPTFQGMVSEEQLSQLVAYVQSLGTQTGVQLQTATVAADAGTSGPLKEVK